VKRSYFSVLIHIACEVITSVVVPLLAIVHSSPGSSLATCTISSAFRHLHSPVFHHHHHSSFCSLHNNEDFS